MTATLAATNVPPATAAAVVAPPAQVSSPAALETTAAPVSHTSLAGAIGAELAAPLAVLQQLVQELTHANLLPNEQKVVLLQAMDNARQVARQSQQIARLAAAKPRQRFEQLALDQVLTQILDDTVPLLLRHAIRLERAVKPADVMVDPGLLSSLLDAMLTWAHDCAYEVNLTYDRHAVAQPDSRISITLDSKNWPKRAVLYLKVTALDPKYADPDAPFGVERLSWYLTAQIAQAMQVKLEKVNDGEDQIVMLEFSHPLDHPEIRRGASPMPAPSAETMTPAPARLGPHKRVLLISEDESLEFIVKKIAWELGWRYDRVPTTAEAVCFCYLESPHMVLVDERLRDPMFEELRHELQTSTPKLPLMEIAVHDNTFEMDGWEGNSLLRVHSSQLANKLVPLMV
ncbi:MAG: hypothetical protein ACKVOO_10540 [Burkholderiaceae bacterium]